MDKGKIAIKAKDALQNLKHLKQLHISAKNVREQITSICSKLQSVVNDNTDPMEEMFSDNGFAYSDRLDDIQIDVQDTKHFNASTILDAAIDVCQYIYVDTSEEAHRLQIPVTEDEWDNDDIDNIAQKALISKYGLGVKTNILNATTNSPMMDMYDTDSTSDDTPLTVNITFTLDD